MDVLPNGLQSSITKNQNNQLRTLANAGKTSDTIIKFWRFGYLGNTED